MTSYMLRLLASLIFYGLAVALWSSPGVPQSFTCDSKTFVDSFAVDWNLHTTNERLFQCTTTWCDPDEEEYLDLYSATVTSSSFEHKSVFTIKNVSTSQNNTEWICIAYYSSPFPEIIRFRLNVYDADEIPLCGNVAAVDNCEIQVTCVILTYKYGTDFNYSIIANTTTERLMPSTFNTDREIMNTTGYYKMTFNFNVLAADLGSGTHALRLQITPMNNTNVELISPYTTPFKIVYPKAVLAPDCNFTDYIKENETRTCTCYDDNPRFLPTQVRWSIEGSSNSTLKFTARRPSNDSQMFQCIVSNSLNCTNTITYRPIIAYPPNINLSLSSREIDICDGKNVNILGNCFLSPSFPQPSVQVYINNVLLMIKQQTNSNLYTFNSTITSSGFFNVTCYANNSAFSWNVSKSLQIKGPPEIPAIYTFLQDDASSPSESTRQVIIMCQSRGGYPYYKNISLTCGGVETEATYVDKVILHVNMTHTATDITCTCVVWHESKCVKNMTTEKLRLYFLKDSSTVKVNIAAIGVGVTLALVMIVFILIIFVIIRRNKRTNGNQNAVLKINKDQEYSNPQAEIQ